MDQELQQKLFAKYPSIFRNVNKSPRESCMAFGIECGNGWYNIIDALCTAFSSGYSSCKIVNDYDTGIEDKKVSFEYSTADIQVVASQVKEKFGGLRFYYFTRYSEEFEKRVELYPNTVAAISKEIFNYYNGIVHLAEIMSVMTCEETGKPGRWCSRSGWIKTLCKEKAEELGYEEIKEEAANDEKG